MGKWTEKEEKTLKKLFRSKTNQELGKILGRSYGSIAYRLNQLGLSRKIEWPDGNDADLARTYQSLTNRELAKKFKIFFWRMTIKCCIT